MKNRGPYMIARDKAGFNADWLFGGFGNELDGLDCRWVTKKADAKVYKTLKEAQTDIGLIGGGFRLHI